MKNKIREELYGKYVDCRNIFNKNLIKEELFEKIKQKIIKIGFELSVFFDYKDLQSNEYILFYKKYQENVGDMATLRFGRVTETQTENPTHKKISMIEFLDIIGIKIDY